MSAFRSVAFCVGFIVFACVPLLGQSGKATLRLKEADVKALVEQLGAAKEADREAAVKKLRAAGLAVIPALGDAAAKGNKHTTNNAVEILTAHLESKDAATRIAAFEELRSLSVGTRPAVAGTAKKLLADHKDLRAEADAAKLAAKEDQADRPDKPSPPAKTATKPVPQPTAPAADPILAMRRQALEQQLKDAETAVAKIKALKLPKDQEAAQISAIMQSMQSVRGQLKELEGKRK